MSEVATTSTADSGSSEGTSEATANTEGITEATATPAQKQAIAQLKEKFKLTVDGEEFEEEIDLNDKEDLRRRFQLGTAAKKRMAEAKEEKRKAFEIIKSLESDPLALIKKRGAEGESEVEKYLLEILNERMLSPEEKEYRATKAENAKYKAMEAKAKEEQEKSVRSAQEMKYAQEFQTTIISALEKSGLPKSPELVKRFAGTLSKSLELGLDLNADDLVVEVKRDILDLVKAITKDSTGDHLLSIFGDDVANKIRKSDLRKLQEKQNQIPQPRAQTTQGSESKSNSSRPMTISQWKESLNKE